MKIDNIKFINYPKIKPWFDIDKLILHDLETHTTKSMGTIQNNRSTLETLNTSYQDYIQLYTDGSKAGDDTTGAAFYVPINNLTSKWRLYNESSIVSAELSAIQKATSWLLLQQPPSKAVILTDSNSSLYLIKQRKPKNYITTIQHIQENILQLISRGWIIQLQWIPSHCGVSGNDIVDQAANEARSNPHEQYHIELNDLYNLVKKKLKLKWQTLWDIERQTTHLGLIKENLENWDWCRHKDRFLDVQMTRLRLGKTGLNKYLKQVKRSDTEICKNCNSGAIEDINHYILTCQAHSAPRQNLFNTLNRMNIHNITVRLLLGSSDNHPTEKKRISEALALYIFNTKRFQ